MFSVLAVRIAVFYFLFPSEFLLGLMMLNIFLMFDPPGYKMHVVGFNTSYGLELLVGLAEQAFQIRLKCHSGWIFAHESLESHSKASSLCPKNAASGKCPRASYG